MIRAGVLLILMVLSSFAAAATEDGVREVLARLSEEHGFPGATLAWTGSKGEVHTLAVGLADPDRNIPMTRDSRMLSASIGKSFVAAAVLTAVEQGKLNLDTPIREWLGERVWFGHLPNHDELTLRQLLTHTGGLPDHVYLPAFHEIFQESMGRQQPPSPDQLIALIGDAEPLFAPGEGWAYSDTGYLIAARVLEAATNQPWTGYVRRHFLKPLDLHDTTPANRRKLPRLATGITAMDNPLGLPRRTQDDQGRLAWHPAIEDAGGGFVTTTRDLARWGHALWSGRVLSEDSFQTMLDGAPVDPERPDVIYGLGVVIEATEEFGEARGHRGWIPGYVSSLRYFPEYDTAIALQINSDVGMMGEEQGFVGIEAKVTRALLQTNHN
jgi:D-alanyl-D-alanine carboxypeptidase